MRVAGSCWAGLGWPHQSPCHPDLIFTGTPRWAASTQLLLGSIYLLNVLSINPPTDMTSLLLYSLHTALARRGEVPSRGDKAALCWAEYPPHVLIHIHHTSEDQYWIYLGSCGRILAGNILSPLASSLFCRGDKWTSTPISDGNNLFRRPVEQRSLKLLLLVSWSWSSSAHETAAAWSHSGQRGRALGRYSSRNKGAHTSTLPGVATMQDICHTCNNRIPSTSLRHYFWTWLGRRISQFFISVL